MPPSVSIALGHDLREIERLAGLVERFCADTHLPGDVAMNVNLVLDELVSNVIKYGEAKNGTRPIEVSLALNGAVLTIEMVDDGIAFNPIDVKAPDLDLPITERPIGGLGIHIVKALTETIAYRRERERNHLRLTMRIA